MKTSIIGYPRIGKLRELKFASEKYFRNEIAQSELFDTAKKLRTENLTEQKNSGLDFIPSNDFSFYDGMLDTAFLLNVVPDRYKTSVYLRLTNILRLQEVIREKREMLKLLR